MKNKKYILAGSIVLLFGMVLPVFAVEIENPISDAFKDFPTAVSTVSSWIRPIAILAYLAMIIYAGFTRQTAGADPEKAKKAIQILIYSTTGFILVILAPLIVNTIGAIFGIDLITN